MTLSEFREHIRPFPRQDIRQAIAAVLPGRTFRTRQEFSDFYDAVCLELQ